MKTDRWCYEFERWLVGSGYRISFREPTDEGVSYGVRDDSGTEIGVGYRLEGPLTMQPAVAAAGAVRDLMNHRDSLGRA